MGGGASGRGDKINTGAVMRQLERTKRSMTEEGRKQNRLDFQPGDVN